MHSATIRQSHKHPAFCTVTVDGYSNQHDEIGSPAQDPERHWRLPNPDPRSEGKYLFRLHTLDIYFWKVDDANKFVAAARGKMQPGQFEIVDVPPTPAAHEKAMSPVVQQLESIAIQDPAYHNGKTRSSRTTSTNGAAINEEARQETPKAQDTTAFQPLAYNPASPAAPEPIKHREKTPPPVDSETGTGLAAAAYQDHTQAMSPGSSLSRPPYGQVHESQGPFSPQPTMSHASSYVSPSSASGNTTSSPPVQGQRTTSVSSFPPPPAQNGRSSASPYTSAPSFAPPPQSPPNATAPHHQQALTTFSAPPPPAQDPNFPFYGKDNEPLESPATQILGSSYVSGVRQPLQHLQPQYADYIPPGHEPKAPVGGYSNYQYNQQAKQHQSPSTDYDIHSQVYRPTEEEAPSHKHKHKPSSTGSTQQSPAGRLEQGAGKVDKGVNRFFKKLEKKIG